MKKFIMNVLGVVATSSNIKGKKSAGCEDAIGYINWRINPLSNGPSSVN